MIEVDVEESQLLADIVVQIAGNPPPFRFLARDEPQRQISIPCIARFEGRLVLTNLRFVAPAARNVPHDTEDVILLVGNEPCLKASVPSIKWKRVFDGNQIVGTADALERLGEQLRQGLREHVPHVLADKLIRRKIQVLLCSVEIDVYAINVQDKELVGDRAKDSSNVGVAVLTQSFALRALCWWSCRKRLDEWRLGADDGSVAFLAKAQSVRRLPQPYVGKNQRAKQERHGKDRYSNEQFVAAVAFPFSGITKKRDA